MSFFIDKQNRRKSPIALVAFGAAFLDLVVFGLMYAFLSEPLYRTVSLGSEIATTAVHTLLVAVLGTAVCCLLFFLPDKRIVPYGFIGLAAVLGMFYAAAFLLDQPARSNMLILITMFGLAPVLVGNAVSWLIYLKIKRIHPALNHRKTIPQELREAIEKENARKAHKEQKLADKAPEVSAAAAASKHPPAPSIDVESALFGPEFNPVPPSSRTAEEEAMLLFVDDEESDD